MRTFLAVVVVAIVVPLLVALGAPALLFATSPFDIWAPDPHLDWDVKSAIQTAVFVILGLALSSIPLLVFEIRASLLVRLLILWSGLLVAIAAVVIGGDFLLFFTDPVEFRYALWLIGLLIAAQIATTILVTRKSLDSRF